MNNDENMDENNYTLRKITNEDGKITYQSAKLSAIYDGKTIKSLFTYDATQYVILHTLHELYNANNQLLRTTNEQYNILAILRTTGKTIVL